MTKHDGPPEKIRSRAALTAMVTIGVGMLALAERLLALFISTDRRWPHSVLLEGDALLWIDWLRSIREGTLFELGLAIHSPVVPFLLAILGADPSSSDWTQYKVVWCLFSALTCSLLYLAALRTVGPIVALLAAVWFAFAYHASALATSLNGEVVYSLLVVAIVLVGTIRPPALAKRSLLVVALGLLHGAATLTRAEHPLLMLMMLASAALLPSRDQGDAVPSARARLLSALGVAFIAAAVCMPWAISGARAAARLNTTLVVPMNYDQFVPPWTDDARAYLDTLPAFVRPDNAAYLSALATQRGESVIDSERVRRYFLDEFGWIPTPLSTRPRVSSQGPLCFALANHPDSGGGFSRAALDDRFAPDPNLTFSLPSHLRLFNEGYAVGLETIRADPSGWISLLGRKMLRFEAGLTGGLGVTDAPIGRELVRWPVDLAARPMSPAAWSTRPWLDSVRVDALWWRVPILLLMFVGAARLLPSRRAAPWLLILASKVVVTLAFYGYVRQGASILPVTSILIAAGVVYTSQWWGAERRWIIGGVAIVSVAVVVMDVRELSRPMIPTIEADADAVRPARVGAAYGAFECLKELRIEYAPSQPNVP